MIEKAIRAELVGVTAIAAAIGSRCYLQQRQQGSALPAITFEVTRIEPFRTLAGDSGLYQAEVTISSVAETYLGARAVADLVRNNAEAFASSGTVHGVHLLAVRFVDEAPLEAGLYEGEENEPTAIEQNYTVHFEEVP
jgi:hypothetical protein